MQLSLRERVAVGVAGVCVTLFFLLQFLLFPQIDKKEKLEKGVLARQKQLVEMVAMQSQYEQFSKTNTTLATTLSSRAEDFSLFSFLEQNASAANVKENIGYMKPSELSENDMVEQSMVEMKLQGISLKQLVAFLELTESSKNLVGIKRASIQVNSKENNTLDVILQIISVDKIVTAQ